MNETFTFPVSGAVTAIPQEITVLDGTTNIVSGQTTPINLGSAVHNATGPSKTFTIHNDGDQTLTLTTPFSSTAHFTVGQPGLTSLDPGAYDHLHRDVEHRRRVVWFREDIVRQ